MDAIEQARMRLEGLDAVPYPTHFNPEVILEQDEESGVNSIQNGMESSTAAKQLRRATSHITAINELRPSSSSSSHVHLGRQQRHSKRLSLNFPISIPATMSSNTKRTTHAYSPEHTASPNPSSAYPPPSPATHYTIAPYDTSIESGSFFPSPLTPPAEFSEEGRRLRQANSLHSRGQARSHTLAYISEASSLAPDFLTLIASQERRVLELKEELQRAETDLQTLKKQWASHEATRKRGDHKAGAIKMGNMAGSPVSPEYGRNHARDYGVSANSTRARTGNKSTSTIDRVPLGLGAGVNDVYEPEASEADREKRRSLMQERLSRRATLEHPPKHPGNKRNSLRKFSSSRHARALSLLATNNLPIRTNARSAEPRTTKEGNTSSESALWSPPFMSGDTSGTADGGDRSPFLMPSLIRSNSGLTRDLDFRKTYQDLASAASRRSLPPGADVLMKQGRLVVDGVRDGLWNFLEDIRQATVGEEAARETDQDSVEKPAPARTRKASRQPSGDDSNGSSVTDNKHVEPSFWREFGVDTPQSDKIKPVGSSQTSRSRLGPASPEKGHSDSIESDAVSPDSPLASLDCAEADQSPTDAERDTPSTSPLPQQSTFPQFKRDHEYHESKSSTDSRDSQNPPSLVSESLAEEQTHADGEAESWEWGEIESPPRVRKVGLVNVDDSSRVTVFDPDKSADVTETNQARTRDRDVLWHELTR